MAQLALGVYAYKSGWRIIRDGIGTEFKTRDEALASAFEMAEESARHGEDLTILAQEPEGTHVKVIKTNGH